MKGRIYVAILMLGLTAGCAEDDPKMLPGKFNRLWEDQVLQSAVLNFPVQYAVLLPEGYEKSDESYPVVYLLHGYGDDETAWYKNGGLQFYADRQLAETGPMIFVMPQAFNTYYIDKYTGSFPYMKMFVEELVPEIDSRFRTKKDKSQRAVMGYSMGGYGALILPAMNPDVFSVSVPLSMSFRTDAQYMAESQGAFDNQWAPNFGPAKGVSGTARLSDYFKARSPFHFFNQENIESYKSVKYLIDCGDDEESLIFTSNNLHSLMQAQEIAHEYRVRSGGHSFDYWKKSYPEALTFISNAFKGISHPTEPAPANIGTLITESNMEQQEVEGVSVTIMKPHEYEESELEYPVLYFIHDGADNHHDNLISTFSILRNAMIASKLTKSIVVEVEAHAVTDEDGLQELVTYVDEHYRTKAVRANRVIMANGSGSLQALEFANNTNLFSDCFIFNAQLPEEAPEVSGTVFYYLDGTDKSASYKGYENLFTKIRNDGTDGYEYRIRQGADSYQGFLNGLSESFSFLKESLSR